MSSTRQQPPTAKDLFFMNDRLAEIGGKVRHLREQRGWTQSKLAEELGFWVKGAGSQPTIAKLELGKREPRLPELYALAMIFSRPADELLGLAAADSTNPTEMTRQLLARLEEVEKQNPFYYS